MNKRGLQPEQVVLAAALLGFTGFVVLVSLFLLAVRPASRLAAHPVPIPATATPEFLLPPTWTPTPPQTVVPTPTPTNVALGLVPTPLYTPRPPNSAGFPRLVYGPQKSLSVIDLARIMQGESPGDLQAAYMVGWVAKNRLLHEGYGDTYAVVSHGFFGYRADIQPRPEFIALARQVIQSNDDPTGGCLYALSRMDITKLGIPPSRADVAYGEWFFFRTWPLTSR
ncbi:MAG: hypothetical protein D6784_08935 [Chloroflexi bacterium]|nr:MAG: hypothetical protein D6784_08935 [Chloroflexota bacterium]